MGQKKFQAVVLAVDHEKPESIQSVLKEYQKIFKKRRTFFCECTYKNFSSTKYRPIIKAAIDAGMRFVALDNPKLGSIYFRLLRWWYKWPEPVVQEAKKMGFSEYELRKTAHYYVVLNLRERKWISKLGESKKGDIALMHPDHAYRIASLLGIKKENVLWIDKPRQGYIARAEPHLAEDKIKKLRELRKKLREQRRRKPK